MQGHRLSILAHLGVGVIALVCTIAIYLVPLRASVNLVRRERRRGHVGTPWAALGIFARVLFYASLTHLLEMASARSRADAAAAGREDAYHNLNGISPRLLRQGALSVAAPGGDPPGCHSQTKRGKP
jgi:hypothetical protein